MEELELLQRMDAEAIAATGAPRVCTTEIDFYLPDEEDEVRPLCEECAEHKVKARRVASCFNEDIRCSECGGLSMWLPITRALD